MRRVPILFSRLPPGWRAYALLFLSRRVRRAVVIDVFIGQSLPKEWALPPEAKQSSGSLLHDYFARC